jgi:hypothetical protein
MKVYVLMAIPQYPEEGEEYTAQGVYSSEDKAWEAARNQMIRTYGKKYAEEDWRRTWGEFYSEDKQPRYRHEYMVEVYDLDDKR